MARAHHADLFWAATTTPIFTLLSLKLYPLCSLQALLLCWAVGPAANATIAWLILRRPHMYALHRVPILTFLKLARAFTLTQTLLPHANQLTPGPWETPVQLALLFLPKGMALLVSALGFQLPLAAHLPIQAVMLVASLSYTRDRCAYECASPRAFEAYRRVAGALGSVLGKTLPVMAVRADVAAGVGAAGVAARAANPCMLAQAWVQTMLGFLVPSLMIDWLEVRLRPAVWYVPRSSGSMQMVTLTLQPAAAVVEYLGLLALACVVVWKGAELLLLSGVWPA